MTIVEMLHKVDKFRADAGAFARSHIVFGIDVAKTSVLQDERGFYSIELVGPADPALKRLEKRYHSNVSAVPRRDDDSVVLCRECRAYVSKSECSTEVSLPGRGGKVVTILCPDGHVLMTTAEMPDWARPPRHAGGRGQRDTETDYGPIFGSS